MLTPFLLPSNPLALPPRSIPEHYRTHRNNLTTQPLTTQLPSYDFITQYDPIQSLNHSSNCSPSPRSRSITLLIAHFSLNIHLPIYRSQNSPTYYDITPASCQTNTSCFVVISCKPPIDPIQLVVKHVENVLRTGVTQTKYAQRLTPISGTCVTNVQEIKALCSRLLEPHLNTSSPTKFSYKIELRMRNHNTLSRPTIIEELAKCVPEGHRVDLENPELFVLVEIWKSVCGIGIVKDYYKLQKFNVMEIAKSEEPGFKAGVAGTGRVQEKTSTEVNSKVEEGKEEEKKAGKEKEGSVQESDS